MAMNPGRKTSSFVDTMLLYKSIFAKWQPQVHQKGKGPSKLATILSTNKQKGN